MVGRIIFFVSSPFCIRDYQRYGIEVFLKNNFEVYVWDITFALHPVLKGVLIPPDPIEWDNHIIFDSKKSVIAALEDCPGKTMIVFFPGCHQGTFGMLRAISRKKIPYILTPLSNIQSLGWIKTMRSRCLHILKVFQPKKLISYFIRRIPLSFFGVSPATFVVKECLKGSILRPGVTGKTKKIRTHILDYDIVLRLGAEKLEAAPKKTAVFLDCYFPYHTDSLFISEVMTVTPEVYYAELRTFFDFLEMEHGLEVIVAAHPRSQYESMENKVFGQRKIVKNKTAELIRASSIVLTHFSTAVSFAVFYKKPVIFFTTSQINRSSTYDYKKYIEDFSEQLGSVLVNISEDFVKKLTIKYAINKEKYDDYFSNYIKMQGSDELPYWQIVSNEVKNFFNETLEVRPTQEVNYDRD